MAPDPARPDLARLATVIRRECERRGWLQEDLITRSGIGRSTIQRLWSGAHSAVPTRRTKRDLEDVFEWEPGAVQAILDGGDPQPRMELAAPMTEAEERAYMIKQLRELRAKLDTAERRLDELEGRGQDRKSA